MNTSIILYNLEQKQIIYSTHWCTKAAAFNIAAKINCYTKTNLPKLFKSSSYDLLAL